jgi:hemoglobin
MNEVEAASKTDLADLAGRPEIEIAREHLLRPRPRRRGARPHLSTRSRRRTGSTHLPKMYAFWETVLFRSGGFTRAIRSPRTRSWCR